MLSLPPVAKHHFAIAQVFDSIAIPGPSPHHLTWESTLIRWQPCMRTTKQRRNQRELKGIHTIGLQQFGRQGRTSQQNEAPHPKRMQSGQAIGPREAQWNPAIKTLSGRFRCQQPPL
tara:strand:+ start:132 stop:482 length:351 start_codon:yes stop_codon:yes gene_type:complete